MKTAAAQISFRKESQKEPGQPHAPWVRECRLLSDQWLTATGIARRSRTCYVVG